TRTRAAEGRSAPGRRRARGEARARGFTVARMRVLVIGAAGELGGAVARLLARSDAEVRAMTRRADAVRIAGVRDLVGADLRVPWCVEPAFAGVDRVFIVSALARDQVEMETNAIVAAELARVQHVVKVSNLPIAGLDAGLHGNHRALENRLAVSSVGS